MSNQEQMKLVEKLSKDMTINKESRDALKWILKEVEEYEAVETYIIERRANDCDEGGDALKAHYREGKIINGKWVNIYEEEEEEEEFKPYYEVQVEDEEGDTEYSEDHFETREEAVDYIKKHHKEDVENERITVNIMFWKYEEGGDIEEYEEEEDDNIKQYRKEIEEGCPKGYKTIWNQYGFRYEEEE
jgi:hypothetical protein